MAASPSYELVPGWEQLPAAYTHLDVSGLGVDSHDRVYVLTRMQPRVLVYEPDGTFAGTFGEGLFTERTHGLTVGPDDAVYCVDDGSHTVRKFRPDGTLVMTIGVAGVAADTGYDPVADGLYDRLLTIKRAGPPFNRPTNLAVAPNGDLYVTDGYGNARVHHFTPAGRLVHSWGEPGSGPGQFRLPHGICVCPHGRVLVADRENDRVQVFGLDGAFKEEWTHVQRPTQVCMDRHGLVFVSELAWLPGQRSFRRGVVGCYEPARVSIMDQRGEVLARLGTEHAEAPGSFWAPHALCVDSQGDLYVGEVAWTFTVGGTAQPLPQGFHTLQKFKRQ
jgi:hypothetical protein